MSRLAHSRQPRLTRRLYSGPGFERRPDTLWPLVGSCIVGLAFWSVIAWAVVAGEQRALHFAMTRGWLT